MSFFLQRIGVVAIAENFDVLSLYFYALLTALAFDEKSLDAKACTCRDAFEFVFRELVDVNDDLYVINR